MTPNESLLSVERLHELLEVDFASGSLTWKPRSSSDAKRANWNAKHAGKPALAYKSQCGYLVGDIFTRRFQAHRVVWAMAHGRWPDEQIDHINGVRSDNRLSNLRGVSAAENARNRCADPRNIAGCSGVTFHKSIRRFVAQIKVDGTQKHLGAYEKLEDAIEARRAAEVGYFHPNHGKPQSERVA